MSLLHIFLVVVVLALLIAFHEFGHFICAKSVGVPVKIFSIGFPLGPKPLLSFKWGETDVQLNALPLGGFCAFMDDENSKDENGVDYEPGDKRFLKNRKIWERTLIISGGVIANMIVAYVILLGLVSFTGVPDLSQSTGVVVNQVIPDSPAQTAGFKAGDKILSIEGKNISGVDNMQDAVKSRTGNSITVKVKRLDEEVTLTPTPTEKGTIGVQIQNLLHKRPVTGPSEAFSRAGQDLVGMTTMLSGALVRLVSGALPLDQVGGLVEVVHMGSKVSQTGFTELMYFAALISVELAILNILPIPALDGGHLLLILLEGLRGKPLPRQMEQNLHYAGFVLLMGLGVFLIFKDVWGLALGKG